MTRGLTVLIVLFSSGVSQGALLSNFAASYALYQQCAMDAADFDGDQDIDGMDFLTWQRGQGRIGQFINTYGDADRNGYVNELDLNHWKNQFGTNTGISDSVCFKLFLDPKGIMAGNVTVIIEAPNPLPGEVRLNLGSETKVVDVHPQYTADVLLASILPLPGRQRLEAIVEFTAIDPETPPGGPITIFGYQALDNLPELGLAGVHVAFEFRPGNSITVFDPDNGLTTTFDHTQLDDVTLSLMAPLILDVNTLTGAVSLRNPSNMAPTTSTEINYYEITSVAGSLDAGGWVSIDDTEMGDPPGIGWEEAGGAGANALSESNLTGTLLLSNGQSHSLGLAFNKITGIHDLMFFYATPQGSLVPGEINYNTTSMVDAVPEPGCFGLALLGLVGVASRRRRGGFFGS